MGFELKLTDLPALVKELVLEMLLYIPAFFILLYIHNIAFVEAAISSVNVNSYLLISLLLASPVAFYFYNRFFLSILMNFSENEDKHLEVGTAVFTMISLFIIITVHYYVKINTTILLISFALIPLILSIIIGMFAIKKTNS